MQREHVVHVLRVHLYNEHVVRVLRVHLFNEHVLRVLRVIDAKGTRVHIQNARR